MKVTPKKYLEMDDQIVHCDGVGGNDFTLCGFSLDGDQGEIIPWDVSRIDCPQCLAIIHFCRSISARSLSFSSPHRASQ